MVTASSHYATCGICRRRADGVGVTTQGKFPATWFCEACGPDIAKAAHRMKTSEFDTYEKLAFGDAVTKAGEVVEAIGFDLSSWTEADVDLLFETFLNTFTRSIRQRIEQGTAPF